MSQAQLVAIEKSVDGIPVDRPRCLKELSEVLGRSQDYLMGANDRGAESTTPRRGHRIATEPVDHTASLPLVSLWQMASSVDGPKGASLQLQRTEDAVAGPRELGTIKSAFAIRVWDNSNQPHASKGATLFVDPSNEGREGYWALFYLASDLKAGTLDNPSFGVLLEDRTDVWVVAQGLTKTTLPKSKWPHSYYIYQVKP